MDVTVPRNTAALCRKACSNVGYSLQLQARTTAGELPVVIAAANRIAWMTRRTVGIWPPRADRRGRRSWRRLTACPSGTMALPRGVVMGGSETILRPRFIACQLAAEPRQILA